MPSRLRGLLAALEEELEPEADAHHRPARARAASRTAAPRPVVASVRERLAEVAHAGHQHPVGRGAPSRDRW